MTTRAVGGTPALVKCVVWDIDNTLLAGTYLEAGERPPAADPVMAGVLADLAGRGILHAIASKNPPDAAAHTARVTGREFAAAECGWGRKSDALGRIARDLGIGVDALAFVDDDPYERAEVSATLPEVLVLSPEEVTDATGWPEFSPGNVTAEARRRERMYAERRRRQEAQRSFGGGREDFLRAAGTRVTIAAAAGADVPRLHELAVRTRQFNSAARAVSEQDLRALLASAGTDVMTVRLQDTFGDDGMVGGCVIERRGTRTWRVPLLMMSCRAMGRGVIDALLAWLGREAARRGAAVLEVRCAVGDRNLPLRLALTAAGFRAGGPEPAHDAGAQDAGAQDAGIPPAAVSGAPAAVFRRDLGGAPPGLPDWVHAPGEPDPGGE